MSALSENRDAYVIDNLNQIEDSILAHHGFCSGDCGEKPCIVEVIHAHRVGPDFVEIDNTSYFARLRTEYDAINKSK